MSNNITITISGPDAGSVMREVLKLAIGMANSARPAQGNIVEPPNETSDAAVEHAAGVNVEVLPPEKPAEGKKRDQTAKKAGEVAPEQADFEDAVNKLADKPADAKPLTADDIRAALRDVASKHGVDQCRKLRDEFGVKSASEVTDGKRAAFVAAAAAWVAK